MSAFVDLTNVAAASATDICWRQWLALGGGAPTDAPAATGVIDPEALVLLSLAVRHRERRLEDQLLWWAGAGAALMSVQRMRTVLAGFPERLRSDVASFAQMAVAGGDPRWRALLGDGSSERFGRPGKGPGELQLGAAATLMLRLRAGLGVGAKADLLCYLLGAGAAASERGAGMTADTIAKAISYSVASTRRAANEMVQAGFLRTTPDRPARYSVDAAAWNGVLNAQPVGGRPTSAVAGDLGGATFARWRHWAQVFAFLAVIVEMGEDAELATAPAVVHASRLRDVAERFQRQLSAAGIAPVDARAFPGERYLDGFGRLLDAVGQIIANEA